LNESKVKQLTEKLLKEQGFKVKPEVPVLGTEREVIIDYWAYRDSDISAYAIPVLSQSASFWSIQPRSPHILWVECKGDVNLSELLEGFIRVEFAVYYGGGLGLLAIPNNATQKLLKYKDFLKNNTVGILNIEKGQIIALGNQK